MIVVKLLISSLIFMASAEVAAGYFPNTSPKQNKISQQLNQKKYSQALKGFEQAFNDTYKKSINGQAFHSYLMFKSGLTLNGLRTLINLKQPFKINTHLRGLWAKAVPINSPVWKIVNVKVSSQWNSVFPYIGNYNGYLYPHYKLKNLKQLKTLEQKKINSEIMLDWHNYQLGIWSGILDRPNRGINYLNKVPRNSKTVDQNQLSLAKARLYFQLKNFDKAIIAYQSISKKSDYWATSLEEQAYTYTVSKKDNLSLAKLKSLFNPVLSGFAGPEPYMLTAFNQEQNCDYISSFKTVGKYKQTFLPRAKALQAISKGQITPAVKHLLSVQTHKNLAWEHSSQFITELPSHFYNDKFLIKYFNGRANLRLEQQKLLPMNISPYFANPINKYTNARVDYLTNKITKRLAYLAKKDLKAISNITKKMHLIEAEVIQQLHIAKDIKKASRFKKSNSREVLVFPDDGELWLDELDKYTASIGFCNKKKGKAL